MHLRSVTKSFAGRVLFENAPVQVNRGDRIGLVGANGTGKTTFFTRILGLNSPDEGSISLQHGMSLGFLRRKVRPRRRRRRCIFLSATGAIEGRPFKGMMTVVPA